MIIYQLGNFRFWLPFLLILPAGFLDGAARAEESAPNPIKLQQQVGELQQELEDLKTEASEKENTLLEELKRMREDLEKFRSDLRLGVRPQKKIKLSAVEVRGSRLPKKVTDAVLKSVTEKRLTLEEINKEVNRILRETYASLHIHGVQITIPSAEPGPGLPLVVDVNEGGQATPDSALAVSSFEVQGSPLPKPVLDAVLKPLTEKRMTPDQLSKEISRVLKEAHADIGMKKISVGFPVDSMVRNSSGGLDVRLVVTVDGSRTNGTKPTKRGTGKELKVKAFEVLGSRFPKRVLDVVLQPLTEKLMTAEDVRDEVSRLLRDAYAAVGLRNVRITIPPQDLEGDQPLKIEVEELHHQ